MGVQNYPGIHAVLYPSHDKHDVVVVVVMPAV
jgi:hypothetical protein